MGKTKIKEEETIVPEEQTEEATEAPNLPESPDVPDTTETSPTVASPTEEPKVEKKKVTPKKGKKARSKKYQAVAEKVDKTQTYALDEAIELAKSVSYSKFEGTLEIHLLVSTKNLRGLVTLPHMAGKSLKIAAFGKNAADSGADVIGDENVLKEIEKGRINFDVLVTTPDWMPRFARLARVLGPRGLMPNPKNGTIGDDLKKIVSELQGGKTEYKAEKDGKSIHLSIGKVNQPAEEIVANIRTLYTAIGKTKIKKLTLTPTMGPGVKVTTSSVL